MKRISRNNPCPCNSGKKYKHCCQKSDEAHAANQTTTKLINVRPRVSSSPPIDEYLQLAIEHHKTGHLPQAEAIYQRILQVAPDHPGALHFLGLIAGQVGKYEIAIELISKALVFKPDYPEAHCNLGNVFRNQGRLEEAVCSYQKALALKPDFPEAYGNLGNALVRQDKLGEAIVSYRNALALKPDFAEMHCILGNAQNEQGKPEEAVASYRNAIMHEPGFAEAYSNLGNTLSELGYLDEAVASFGSALRLKPDFAEAHNNLGNALRVQGKLDEAIASYRKALACRPDYAEAYGNLGNTFREQGKLNEAIASYQSALRIRRSPELKSGFAQCIRNVYFTHEVPGIRRLVASAISEPWGRPADLANPAISLIKLHPGIRECIDRATTAWPARLSQRELLGQPDALGFATVCDDLLLRSLLENTTVCDVELERFLIMARTILLDTAISEQNGSVTEGELSTFPPFFSRLPEENTLTFYCALARQCFINEYIFVYSEEEFDRAQSLRERLAETLATGSHFPVLWLVAVAAYFPLSSLACIETMMTQPWLDGKSAISAVVELLAQQVREPMAERHCHPLIPRLTPVTDDVSRLVQKQYEENSYPRWVKAAPAVTTPSIHSYLRKQFPFSQFELMDLPDRMDGGIDILIAGCGTGQHSIATAQRYKGAKVLAVDLSMTSLCYAKRKTEEAGLKNIEYAQADIMHLSTPGRTFDLIEAVGVLHHLANPLAGWRKLLSLLCPGGFMRLGFYSEYARQSETAAHEFIAKRGYKPVAADIRHCRQDLMSPEYAGRFKQVLSARDFYGMSECRDMLFHVQEHRYTLPQLKECIRQLGLTFIGFSLDVSLMGQYQQQFPADRPQTDLDNWHIFETDHPDTFSGMYQFWVQKPH
jgi:tetratricopeptide (TPR) repeat protein/2-polyprenyl-3-methyl-5-hydroxy-6-metoxy-1,4-benzoquinol methylase